MTPRFGIDLLLTDEERLDSLSRKKVALLTNQSSLTSNYVLSAKALKDKIGPALRALLTPEHGLSGLIAEGVSVGDGYDPHLELPVISLYGENNSWSSLLQDMGIEAIVIDLQDVGLRCYTYGLTCAKIIDSFAGSSLEIIVCDRPNPFGHESKGPLLEPGLRSCVGHFEIPFQHGKTLGQILMEYNLASGLDFTVIPCEPYHKPYQYPWIPPSPNLPSWDSVLLYPALVMLEGTNVSEGRGTSLPFTSLGAPHLDQHSLVDFINEKEGNSLRARPISFTPTSGKLAGVECRGAHLFVTDHTVLDAYSLGINILNYLNKNYNLFKWTPIIDEGKDIYFIDYLLGTREIRKTISI